MSGNGIETKFVKLDAVVTGKYQPRESIDTTSDDFIQLAASIKENGILNALLVTEAEEEGRYYLLAGERRLAAAREAGSDEVPIRLLPGLSDLKRAEVSLADNLLRTELSSWEIAVALNALVEENGVSQDELAKHMGTTAAKLSRQMSILKGPEWLQSFVRKNRVGYSVSSLLVRLARKYPEKKAKTFAKRYRDKEYGKRDLEKLLSAAHGKSAEEIDGGVPREKRKRYSGLFVSDEEKGTTKVKAFTISKNKPPTKEQAEEIVSQLDELRRIVLEFAETGEQITPG